VFFRGNNLEVTIEERKISLTPEYDISAPGRALHARQVVFALLNKIEVQTEDGSLVATIQNEPSLFRSKYEFAMADRGTFEFQCEQRLKCVYECEGGESLQLYRHKGLRYSVFRGEGQIAAFAESPVNIGMGGGMRF
jgi:hypothetical protein